MKQHLISPLQATPAFAMSLMLLMTGTTLIEQPAATVKKDESLIFPATEWLTMMLRQPPAMGKQAAADLAPPGHDAIRRRRRSRPFAPLPAVIEFTRPTGETDF